jgi:aminopeptidase-like protein
MKKQYKFLAMWDCDGLECLFDVTDMEGDAMMSGLKGETYKVPFNLGMMMMRARYNNQRSYEIYTFTTLGMKYKDVKDMFDNDPQVIVESIRENGNMIYSDYSKKAKVIS